MGLQAEVAGEVRFSGSLSCRLAAEYFGRQQPAGREHLISRALEIGVFCLERTSTSQDMEFVRRQVEGLLHDVTSAIDWIPQRVEDGLMAKVGTGNGQVLAISSKNMGADHATKTIRSTELQVHRIAFRGVG